MLALITADHNVFPSNIHRNGGTQVSAILSPHVTDKKIF